MSIPRDITANSRRYWHTDEVLVFVGARQSGKTTILKQIREELMASDTRTHFLNLEDPEYLTLLNEHPRNLFRIVPTPTDTEDRIVVFIDEVQYLDDPSNVLKYLYDEYKGRLKLIVSGSSAFYMDSTFNDSLAGRKHLVYVPTLSFNEYLRFVNADVALPSAGGQATLETTRALDTHFRNYIVHGGYPRVVLSTRETKEEMLRELVYSFVKKDVHEAGVRNERAFYSMLRILAEQTGSLVNAQELANTLNVSRTAVDHYLFVMQKSFLIQLVPPFYRNVRKELTKMPKVYFMDLGLRNFLMRNFEQYSLRHDKGALLENAVFRELLNTYDRDLVCYWRTTDKHELDFVLNEKRVIEVKANPTAFRPRAWRIFHEAYPNTTIELATLGGDTPSGGSLTIRQAWAV